MVFLHLQDEDEEEELSEDAPVDHRQIKEDHIEIYGSDEGTGGGGDGSGGGGDPGDGEISEEMYQDDDMHDDGSQVSLKLHSKSLFCFGFFTADLQTH